MTTDTTMPAQAVEPEIEVDAPEIEAEAEPETQEQETPDDDGEGQSEGEGEEEAEGESEPEEVEFKLGAKSLKLPKGAMPDALREEVQKFVNDAEATTTRKFQELAEGRKAIEARAEFVQKLQGMNDQLLPVFSQGLALKQELEQLSKVDIGTLWQSNPDQARQVSDAIAAKQAQLQQIAHTVNQTEQQLARAQAAEIERQDAEGRALIERKIKGFSQKAPEVIEYAVKEYGVDRKEAERYGLNPVAATAMYKAMLYDRMQAARTAKPKTTPAPAKPIAAVAKGGAAKPGKSVKDMSPSEMARHLGLPG